MSLPITVNTVGELREVLEKLPQHLRLAINSADVPVDCNLQVCMDDEWTDATFEDHKEEVIRLWWGDRMLPLKQGK